MPRINILKQVKVDGRWRLVSVPKDRHGRSNWKALPEGGYFVEWYENGKRKRQAAGTTTAQALQTARRRKHILEGKALGFDAYIKAEEEAKKIPLHIAVKHYLEQDGLVNTAAIYPVPVGGDLSEAAWAKTYLVNVTGNYLLARAAEWVFNDQDLPAAIVLTTSANAILFQRQAARPTTRARQR